MTECIDEMHMPTFEDLQGSLSWLQGELDRLVDQQQEVCSAVVSLNEEIGDTIATPLTTAQRKEIEDKLVGIKESFADAQKQAGDLWTWYTWIDDEVEFGEEDERYD